MQLLRDKWLPIFEESRKIQKRIGMDISLLSKVEQSMEADYRATEILLSISETIVLPSQIMLDLVHGIKRIDTVGWIHLPYPYITVQFTHPIKETDLMAHEEVNDLQKAKLIKDDYIMGLVIGNANQAQQAFPPQHVFNMMNCCVLFTSTSVNRVAWQGTNHPAEPDWGVSTFMKHEIPKTHLENKMRIIVLCYALNLFLNAPNVKIHRQRPDPKVQAHRAKKGKRVLPEYHTVTIDKVQFVYSESNKGSGTAHGRMYPVRGHFRQLKQFADPVWVRNHFRGLQYGEESMMKEVYRVPPKKTPPDGIDSSQS